MAEVRGGEHHEVGGLAEELARHRGHGERHQLQPGDRLGRIADDPLPVLGVDEEADPRERALEALALGHQLLLGARGRRAQERLG